MKPADYVTMTDSIILQNRTVQYWPRGNWKCQ